MCIIDDRILVQGSAGEKLQSKLSLGRVLVFTLQVSAKANAGLLIIAILHYIVYKIIVSHGRACY